MREIKFRAWSKCCNSFLDITGFECVNGKITGIFDDGDYIGYDKEDITLMQFTGLHDKNGKEIYEGDIVEYKDFSNGMYLFKEQPKARGVIKIDNLLIGIYLKGMGTFEESKAEIIGNIHDNPELLKEASHEA